MCSPDSLIRLAMGDRRNEVFGWLFLDNRHRIRAVEELFQGTIDGATIALGSLSAVRVQAPNRARPLPR